MRVDPTAGGWLITCDGCARVAMVRTVDGAATWTRGHRCATADASMIAHRRAAAHLARLTPDPLDVVIARRHDLIGASS